MTSKRVVARSVAPHQSPLDVRAHRTVRLANGLRATLVSDTTAPSAAAALAVNVGSVHNPRELLGLAHFLEHMLVRAGAMASVGYTLGSFTHALQCASFSAPSAIRTKRRLAAFSRRMAATPTRTPVRATRRNVL